MRAKKITFPSLQQRYDSKRSYKFLSVFSKEVMSYHISWDEMKDAKNVSLDKFIRLEEFP